MLSCLGPISPRRVLALIIPEDGGTTIFNISGVKTQNYYYECRDSSVVIATP
jgi:hypothetical protein